MEDQKRNLNPHKSARAAMWLYSHEYSNSRKGSMDFWDSLTNSQRGVCRNMVREVNQSRIDPEETE